VLIAALRVRFRRPASGSDCIDPSPGIAAGRNCDAHAATCQESRGGRNSDGTAERDDRRFGIVNAVQWVAVFLIFAFFPKLGYADLAFPAVLLVVSLHFFLMPASYRHRSNFVTGSVLVVWAMLCPLLFRGDRMIAFVALGAGLTLWLSAAWALAFAYRTLRLAQL